MLRIIITILFLALGPVVLAAQDVPFGAPAGEVPHLRVELHWGRIIIATHDQPFARIAAEGQSNVDGLRSLNEPRLAIDTAAGRISVAQPEPERGNFRSAEITVLVPERCHLELVMLRGGDIEVRDVTGEISVTNRNGSVALHDVAGAAMVNASNGSIAASFRAVDPESDLQFITLNGSVELCLPEDFAARLALHTEGDPILSRFEVAPAAFPAASVPAVESAGGETVLGQVGDSERWLVASTLNGEIRLERCP